MPFLERREDADLYLQMEAVEYQMIDVDSPKTWGGRMIVLCQPRMSGLGINRSEYRLEHPQTVLLKKGLQYDL